MAEHDIRSLLLDHGGTLRFRPSDGAGDDFFCLRFRLWYPSRDCAIRTKHRTCPGCLECDQGRFNLKRHAADLVSYRFPLDLED